MKALAVVLGAITGLLVVATFAAIFVAIWEPWGHRSEWRDSALFLFILADLFVGGTWAAWEESRKR